ncbi:MAG: glycoside hydrolase family 3 protein [Paludibacteraceae bacterium]|nr:glycoside hydrolase family 3 protein [Paludibacteraceae bacterium]
MRKIEYIVLVSLVLLVSCTPRLGRDSDEAVIAAMTVEEKINLLVGTCVAWPNPPYPAPNTIHRGSMPEDYAAQVISTARMEGRVPGSAGQSYAIPRLGIPSIVFSDGPVGVRIDAYTTAFPSTCLLASTRDTDLVYRVGQAIGEEMLSMGVDILLAPGMNLMRNPLCGRNYEYLSSDPDLCGQIASAYVRGVQSCGVGACLKHFAVNNQETYRNGIDVQLSDSLLRNHYLKAFEYTVRQAKPWTVMSAYNRVNGVLASENKYLLTDILRDEWQFDGFVMTDWWAEEDPVKMQQAGCNMQMPGTPMQKEQLRQAIADGTLDEAVLDRNLLDVLRIIRRTPTFRGVAFDQQPALERHALLAREAAAKGMVLLENRNNTLPLDTQKVQKVALMGVGSYNVYVGGSGSGNVTRKYKVSLADALAEAGYPMDSSLCAMYRDYVKTELGKQPAENFWCVPTISEMAVDKKEIERLARETDICLLTLQRMAGEGADRQLAKGDYFLTETEEQLLRMCVRAFHIYNKRVVLLLNIGSSIHLTQVHTLPDAILLTWLPGQEAGHAMLDVLTGRVSMQGQLPMPFYYDYEDVPSAANFPWSDGDANKVIYREGTAQPTRTLYPFGYGLTY